MGSLSGSLRGPLRRPLVLENWSQNAPRRGLPPPSQRLSQSPFESAIFLSELWALLPLIVLRLELPTKQGPKKRLRFRALHCEALVLKNALRLLSCGLEASLGASLAFKTLAFKRTRVVWRFAVLSPLRFSWFIMHGT